MNSSLSFADNLKLFFNLAAGIFIVQIGMFLVPGMTALEALAVAVLGTLIGTYTLSKIAEFSADRNKTTGGLFEDVFGVNVGTKLLIAMNALMFLGWAAIEVIIVRDLISGGFDLNKVLVTIVTVAIIAALCFSGTVSVIKKTINKVIGPLLIIGLVWMTVVAIQQLLQMSSENLNKAFFTSTGEMPFLLGLDMIIALPVSWALCISELTKHSENGKASFKGSYIGYAISNIWCVVLGIFFGITNPGSEAAALVGLMMFGSLLALIIAATELDNGFSNILSSIQQTNVIFKKLSFKLIAVVGLAALLGLALLIDAASFPTYLLLVATFIVPVLGVMIAHYMSGYKGVKSAFFAYIAGVITYQSFITLLPTVGATLPSIVVSAGLFWLLARK